MNAPSARKTVLRLVGNAMSVLTSDMLNRATTFIVYALVSRYLDTRAFGQLSIALALLYMFQVFAVLGLPVLVTREVAKHPLRTAAYLVNGGLLTLGGGLTSLAALAAFVWVMRYDADTAAIVLIVGAALVPYSLSTICESIFRGWERVRYIAYANVPVSIAKIGLAYYLLERGGDLWSIATLLLASHFVLLAVQACLVLRCLPGQKWEIDLKFMKRMARMASTFFGIDALLAVWASLSIVLLSKMVDVEAVAAYNAAVQLLVPLWMFSQSVTTCVFPMLCRKFDATQAKNDLSDSVALQGSAADSQRGLQRLADRLIEVLLAVAIPGTLALFYLADSVLVFVYGQEDFAQAAVLLRIMVPMVLLRALTGALGNVLLAGMRERVTLRIVAVDLVAGLVLGIVLIWQFGVVGAAVATLLGRLIDFLQHYAPAKQLISEVALVRLAWPCVVASAAMVICLNWWSNMGLLPLILAGGSVYVIVLLALLPYSHGSIKEALVRNS